MKDETAATLLILGVLAVIIFIFVGIPLLRAETARQEDNKKNNTNKTLGEWMSDNKGQTVFYFLLLPGLILVIPLFFSLLDFRRKLRNLNYWSAWVF